MSPRNDTRIEEKKIWPISESEYPGYCTMADGVTFNRIVYK